MDTIFQWIQELQKRITFLNETLATVILTLLFWLIVALLLRFVLYALLHRITRGTDTDVDDVIMDTVSAPLLFIVIMLGLHDSLRFLPIADGLGTLLDHTLIIAVIIISAFTVRRLAWNVGFYYGTRYEPRTESNLDDVLLLIVDRIIPIIIYAIGAIILLDYLGLNLNAILLGIGGMSFILALALQDILSNIFFGISLRVDTPFGYHDLVVLSDGKLCEVRRLGLRATELYDIATHSLVYVPYSRLANEKLLIITRPSPDLIDTIEISVSTEADPELVKKMLYEVTNGHPDVLGKIETKLQHLDSFHSLESGNEKRAKGRERLQKEMRVDRVLVELFNKLERLIHFIKQLERQGRQRNELEQVEQSFLLIMAQVGLKDNATTEYNRRKITTTFDSSSNDTLIVLACDWINTWVADPDLIGPLGNYYLEPPILSEEEFDESNGDRQRLLSDWGRRLQILIKRVTNLREEIADTRRDWQRLSYRVQKFTDWLREQFKEPSPSWKAPNVDFLGWDERGQRFGLEFYIDNILLEHFERRERIERELFAEISRKFRDVGIEIAFPTQMLWVKSLPNSTPGKVK